MKLILADSNEIVRVGLRTILATEQNITIVSEAVNSDDLLSQTKSFDPNIILLDYTAKGFTIDVIPQLLQRNPHILVVAITPEQSAQTLVSALRSGVKSYIKKDCDSSEIIDSVRETWRGNKFFCGQILETIRDAEIDVNDIDFDSFTCEPIVLSERETEIIKMISEGLTNIQIAEVLCLSNHTVNTHRKNIMAKLGVKNTAGIVMYSVKTNLISPNKFLFAADQGI